MAKSSRPNPEADSGRPDLPDLPHFGERLPLLLQALQAAAADLAAIPKDALYLQPWERVYRSAHTLKGLTKVLDCEAELGKRVSDLSDTLAAGVSGNQYIASPGKAAAILTDLATVLASGQDWEATIQSLRDCYTTGPNHEERLQHFKAPLPNLNPIVTKRAYCAKTHGLPTWIINESMPLHAFADWEGTMDEFARTATPVEGLLLHCVPRLAGGRDSQIEAWAWIAAPTPDDRTLLARLQAGLPQATISPHSL